MLVMGEWCREVAKGVGSLNTAASWAKRMEDKGPVQQAAQ